MGGGGQCIVIVKGVEPYNMHSSFYPKDHLKIKTDTSRIIMRAFFFLIKDSVVALQVSPSQG